MGGEDARKAGTLGIIGVYPQTDHFFPIGAAMNKTLTLDMGNCNHRTYIPKLLEMVEGGTVDPMAVLSHIEPMSDVIAAYKEFDLRRPGWIQGRAEARRPGLGGAGMPDSILIALGIGAVMLVGLAVLQRIGCRAGVRCRSRSR